MSNSRPLYYHNMEEMETKINKSFKCASAMFVRRRCGAYYGFSRVLFLTRLSRMLTVWLRRNASFWNDVLAWKTCPKSLRSHGICCEAREPHTWNAIRIRCQDSVAIDERHHQGSVMVVVSGGITSSFHGFPSRHLVCVVVLERFK